MQQMLNNRLFLFLLYSILLCAPSASVKAQIFIPFSFWGCSVLDFTDDNSGAFGAGVAVNSAWDGTDMALTVGQTSGTYTSRVFDKRRCNSPFAAFTEFSWTSILPFGKEIPATSETTTDYPSLASSTLMTSIAGVWHFNGTGAIANGATVASATGVDGIARNANASGLTYTTNAKLNSAITFDGVDDRIDLVGYTQTNVTQYTISVWVRSNGTGNRVFVQDRGAGPGRSLTLAMGTNPGGCTATNGRVNFGLDSDAIWIGRCASAGAINDNNWHHVVGVWSGTSGVAVAATQFTIYIDGVSVATTNRSVGTAPNAPISGSGDTKIGRHDAWNVFYVGDLDELAIWTRALSATEVQQLYRRGANRVKFQVRSCLSPTCADNPTWLGPDGSSSTYFTELNNNNLPESGLGAVRTASPVMTYADFISLILPNTQYYQYQMTLESDSTTLVPSIRTFTTSY